MREEGLGWHNSTSISKRTLRGMCDLGEHASIRPGFEALFRPPANHVPCVRGL